jgi:hypothetical protein
VKDASLYDGNNLNDVWPRAKALAPQWRWNQDPPAKK